jgi:hypothetical protein
MASKLLLSLLDEAKSMETIRSMRWPDGVRCPKCNSEEGIWSLLRGNSFEHTGG